MIPLDKELVELIIGSLILAFCLIIYPIFFVLSLSLLVYRIFSGVVPKLLVPVQRIYDSRKDASDHALISMIFFLFYFIVPPIVSGLTIYKLVGYTSWAHQADKGNYEQILYAVRNKTNIDGGVASRLMEIYAISPESFSDKIDQYRFSGVESIFNSNDKDVIDFFVLSVQPIIRMTEYFNSDKKRKVSAVWKRIQTGISDEIEKAAYEKKKVVIVVEGKDYLDKAEYYWSGAVKSELEENFTSKATKKLASHLYMLAIHDDTKVKIEMDYSPSELSVRSSRTDQIAKPYIAAIPNTKWKVLINDKLISEGEKKANEESPAVDQELQFKFSMNGPIWEAKKGLKQLIKQQKLFPSQDVRDELEKRFKGSIETEFWW